MRKYKWPIIRGLMVVFCALLSLGLLPWPFMVKLLPAASPFVGLAAAIARRALDGLTLLGLPLLILALLRGRWFCYHLCPLGALLAFCGKLNCKARLDVSGIPRLAPYLALFVLGGALAGSAGLLFLDPLVLWTALFSVWRREHLTWLGFVPAGAGMALVLFSFLWPHAWCERLCPLGAVQCRLGAIGKRLHDISQGGFSSAAAASGGAWNWRLRRRAFLSLLGGCAAGWLMAGKIGGGQAPVVRPPGAVADPGFSGLCARCGNCLQACPEKIIQTDLAFGNWRGWFAPRVDFRQRYCNEWCRVCTTVCPTGALRLLSVEAKQSWRMGRARIDKKLCLAWERGEYCMVCDEFCPYQAIRIVRQQGVNCPEVDEALCRGCGACESNCPAEPARAIVVEGIVRPGTAAGA